MRGTCMFIMTNSRSNMFSGLIRTFCLKKRTSALNGLSLGGLKPIMRYSDEGLLLKLYRALCLFKKSCDWSSPALISIYVSLIWLIVMGFLILGLFVLKPILSSL